MANDMIVLFNRLTSSELADYSIFDDVLQHHYEKFKLFYKIFKKIDLKKIEEIYAININDSTLNISINARDNKYISDMVKFIDKFDMSKFSWCNITSESCDTNLLVSMSLVDDLCEEGDLYANRLI